MTVKRTTQVLVEALSTTDPKARVSQQVVEALSNTDPKARVSQIVVEVLSSVASGVTQPLLFVIT